MRIGKRIDDDIIDNAEDRSGAAIPSPSDKIALAPKAGVRAKLRRPKAPLADGLVDPCGLRLSLIALWPIYCIQVTLTSEAMRVVIDNESHLAG